MKIGKWKFSRGFTLIELLVVIAIISVLASVLLPSLNRARDMARGVVCMSQERQIGYAFAMYSQDWNGYFPPHGSSGDRWAKRLSKVWDGYISPSTWDPCDSGASIWNCPSGVYKGFGSINGNVFVNYSYNTFVGRDVNLGESGLYMPIRQHKVHKSGDTILMSDWYRYDRVDPRGILNAPSAGSFFYITYRHTGGDNFLFCDNHVERLVIEDVQGQYIKEADGIQWNIE